MKTMKRSLAVAALLCLAALHSHAQTITTFASTPGAAQWKNDSGAGTVTLTYDGSGPPAIDGATTITWQQGPAPLGVTTLTASYTGNLAGASGSIQVQCDDTCTVVLNGTQLGATTQDQWNTIQTFAIPAGVYVNGINALTLAVTNTAGYTGAAFLATATLPPAATLNACPLPTVQVVNPKIPSAAAKCALPTNAVQLAADGAKVAMQWVAAPVHLIYCAGPLPVCNAPFMYFTTPMAVGPNAQTGGPPVPGQSLPGMLYLIPGLREATLAVTPAGGTQQPPITIPAATN